MIVFFPQSHSTSFTQVLTISVTNSNASRPRANPPCRSRKSHASASVSVWFRGKERPNDEERNFRFWRKMKWEPNSERDGATLLALLKQRHANRLQVFYRENCIETCQVHVLTRVRAKWNRNGKNIFAARSRETILGDPGADSGDEGSPNGRKNMARRKVKNGDLYFSSRHIFPPVWTFPRPHYLPLGLRGCRETRFTRPNKRACSQVKVWHTNFHMAMW